MIERLANRAIAAAIDRLEQRAAELPADVLVERSGDGLVLSGVRLAIRRIADARLRWFGLRR